uniref:Uncharacterized protein n=1 Tax=Brassica oleracea TaxID=3712 RepID=A0A3P6E6R8_BRAOL|nr:unnamed protein product [Brassica oleracea]
MEKLQLPLCLAVEATSLSSGYDIIQFAWCSSYYVENSGDPYQKQMEECIDLIMNTLLRFLSTLVRTVSRVY